MPDMPAVYRAEETLVEKPWGYEIRWATTERYLVKILHVRKGEALSLQYHERKDEWLLVTRGTVDMELGVGLIVVAAPVLLGYLRSAGEPPAVEHYIPVALGAITLAGLASSPVFSLQLWQFASLSVLFGVGFVVAGRLDYLRIHGSEKRGHV